MNTMPQHITERDLDRIRQFTLMDDTFCNSCLQDSLDCAELMLHVILSNDGIHVRRVTIQSFIPNLKGRSVQTDALIEDADGGWHCLEIQQKNDGANPKRPRYLSSMLDARAVNKGTAWKDIPPTHVIFITRSGIFGKGHPLCEFQRTMKGTGMPLGDESSILYVDSSVQDDTPLGRLMHDFCCPDPDEMHYPVLAERARYFKQTKEGVSKMCEIMEEIREEGREEGLKEGRKEGRKEGLEEGLLASVRNLMDSMEITAQQAMDALKIPLQDRDSLAKQL